jgi:hypothetical protein
MSFNSIARAAVDQHLVDRVNAAAHQIIQTDAEKAATDFGKQLTAVYSGAGMNPVGPLMWPVAISTEAAYEAALLGQRGAPGYDVDIITDAALFAAVNAAWPMTTTLAPVPAPGDGGTVA